MAKMIALMPVTRNCGITTKMLCIPYRARRKIVRLRVSNEMITRTNQDDSCLRAQAPLTRPRNPILDRILSEIGEIYPAATRMGVSHETLSVAIMLPHLFVRITAFHCEQLIVLLR
jgi:hypothetical protein